VYRSGNKDSQFSLADAKTICLMECPLAAEDEINFVCDCPDGDIHSVDDWIDKDYEDGVKDNLCETIHSTTVRATFLSHHNSLPSAKSRRSFIFTNSS
jgi:hypothetical protein